MKASYLLGRGLSGAITLLGASLVVFILMNAIPGDFVTILTGAEGGSADQLAELRQAYGLDQPVFIRFGFWLVHVVTGDLGQSYVTGRPVMQELAARLPVTLQLTLSTLIISSVLGTTVGVVLSANRNSAIDNLGRVLTLAGMSLPNFAFGMILILLVSTYVPSLYVLGYVDIRDGLGANLRSLLLPVVALSTPLIAIIARMTRASVLELISQDFVTVARAKGLVPAVVLIKHVLKNALIPIITIISFQVGYLLGGAIVIEQVFSLPGIARALFTAIGQRDYPLLQGVVLFMATAYIVVNFLTDVAYLYIDPRIEYR